MRGAARKVRKAPSRARRLEPLRPALRKTFDAFGIRKLRPAQSEVLHSIMSGKDTLAILPTGGGKSLCYQLPGLHRKGTTVVVSPLIALMKDQKEKIDALGLESAAINSALSAGEREHHVARIKRSAAEFVFTTPEQLAHPDFMAQLRGNRIDLFVVDEAHCVSQWGHDFRPDYLGLRAAIRALGRPQVLALTATATPNVVEDIRERLGLEKLSVVSSPVLRENLRLGVILAADDGRKRAELLRLLHETQGSCIIYSATIRQTEELAGWLGSQGIGATHYHGRLAQGRRGDAQDRFMRGEARVMVATSAFGMGIDKPDIRAVIHYHIPASLDAYYQEAGRAGRDGKPALCLLLFSPRDKSIQAFLAAGKYPEPREILAVDRELRKLIDGGRPPVPLSELDAALPSSRKTRLILALLKDRRLVKEPRRGRFAPMDARRPPEHLLAEIAAHYRRRVEIDREKFKRMVMYAETALCRWRTLTSYFGQNGFEHCGHCDNCDDPVESRLQASGQVRIRPFA